VNLFTLPERDLLGKGAQGGPTLAALDFLSLVGA
jgi:hypothetical protein